MNQKLLIDFEDNEVVGRLNLTDLVYDFAARYKRELIDDFEHYQRFLDENTNDKISTFTYENLKTQRCLILL